MWKLRLSFGLGCSILLYRVHLGTIHRYIGTSVRTTGSGEGRYAGPVDGEDATVTSFDLLYLYTRRNVYYSSCFPT